MRMLRPILASIRILPAILLIALMATTSARSQDGQFKTKKELIGRFAELTKANNLDVKVSISLDDFYHSMMSAINDRKDLADSVKADLKKDADERFARVAAQTQKTINESSVLAQLGEKVVYDVYDSAFTESELRDMVTFFATPAGQKSIDFIRTSMDQLSAAFTKMLNAKVLEIAQPAVDAELKSFTEKVKKSH